MGFKWDIFRPCIYIKACPIKSIVYKEAKNPVQVPDATTLVNLQSVMFVRRARPDFWPAVCLVYYLKSFKHYAPS